MIKVRKWVVSGPKDRTNLSMFWTKASFHAFAVPFIIYERMKIIFLSSSLYILLFNAKYKWQSCRNELSCSRFPSNSVRLLIRISFPFECGIVAITAIGTGAGVTGVGG